MDDIAPKPVADTDLDEAAGGMTVKLPKSPPPPPSSPPAVTPTPGGPVPIPYPNF